MTEAAAAVYVDPNTLTPWDKKHGQDPGSGALDPIEEVTDGQTD